MKITPIERFCIADLGCSAGPNTLFIAGAISKAIQEKCMAMGSPMPELQVFFSDLPSNDFNFLFQSLPLPPNVEEKEEEEGEDIDNKNSTEITRCNYFAAGVAGSFYNRLLPKSLSTLFTPRSVYTGFHKVHISKEGPVETGQAYLGQFEKDFHSFLRARSREVVGGGCMSLTIAGRPDACDDPRDQGPLKLVWDTLNSAFNDRVTQGVIKGGIIKGYKRAIKEEISNREALGRRSANHCRAILEGLISASFGEEVVAPLLESFAGRIAENPVSLSSSEGSELLVVLERK
ncbi:hypothetical protein SUGI_0183430 [Cryptomeria japonica]|nr:hypothetical protein SUGI_0183430 [Cryptomeria japonica]